MTKVKICGLSTPEVVQTAVEAGADYIGFVFAPSKRQVTLEQARQLATGIPKGVQKVGVFVSPQREEVEQACQVVGLDLIQVHGPIDETILQDLPQQTIRAVQMGKDAALPETSADYLLFDAPVAKARNPKFHKALLYCRRLDGRQCNRCHLLLSSLCGGCIQWGRDKWKKRSRKDKTIYRKGQAWHINNQIKMDFTGGSGDDLSLKP